jgi:hypothetical protein
MLFKTRPKVTDLFTHNREIATMICIFRIQREFLRSSHMLHSRFDLILEITILKYKAKTTNTTLSIRFKINTLIFDLIDNVVFVVFAFYSRIDRVIIKPQTTQSISIFKAIKLATIYQERHKK